MDSNPQLWVNGVNFCCSSLGDGYSLEWTVIYHGIHTFICCSSFLQWSPYGFSHFCQSWHPTPRQWGVLRLWRSLKGGFMFSRGGGFVWVRSFYYEQQIKRELQEIHMYECRYNERLKSFSHDPSTGFYFLLLRGNTRAKEKTYIWLSVWWKTKSQSWGIYTSRIHWVVWGTGTPQDKDEVTKREVCECDGCVSDLEDIGVPSIFRVI